MIDCLINIVVVMFKLVKDTMNGKYISKQSGKLLAYFNSNNIECFDFELAKEALPNSKNSALRELLSDMTKRGLLMRVKRGLYYIIPYEKDADKYMPDWHILAGHLARDTDYYIGYYSALQIHNLITQPSLKEQIVVAKQVRPSLLSIKGIDFQFIYHNPKHYFGTKKIWIDNFNKVSCSDLEKTIIDCLFKPDYAGGITEIARAIYISRRNIRYNILLDYIKKFNSQAVIKRLGFLLDILQIETEIKNDLQYLKTGSIVLLDTELPKSGKVISKWSIRKNIDIETIISGIYT